MQEKRFTKAVGEMIALRFIEDWATSDDDGIRVKPGVEENDPAQVLSWTPACEMEGWPDSQEASTYPALPYPFTAKELAAFLLAGAGSMVAEYYGDFSDGPDEDNLQALGIKAGHARDALRQAYTEIRLAIAEVGEVDQQLQQKAQALRHQFNDANLEANRREGLWEPGISEDERRVRRERARQSVEELKMEMDSVGRDADSALKNWNAAMVKALLYPAPELTDAAAPPEAVLMPPQAPHKRQRRDLITPAIEKAVSACDGRTDRAEVFSVLRQWATEKPPRPPLIGVTEKGIKWVSANDEPKELTVGALGKRLKPPAKRG